MPPSQNGARIPLPAQMPNESSTAERFGLSDEDLELELEYLEVDQSMAGSRRVIVPNAILLVTCLTLMLPYSPIWACALWAGSFALYIAARWRVNHRYALSTVAERKARLRERHRSMVVNAFIFGAIVASASVIAFPGSPLEIKLLWTMVQTLVLIVVITSAPRLVTLRQFIALVIAPLVLSCGTWLVWGGLLGPPMAAALAALNGLFVVLMRYFHGGLREKFELQLRNEHLARELAIRNSTLEQMVQAKTMLLTAASHDLRQPVHALGLLMENIQRTVEPCTLRRRLAIATDCVESLSDMLTNLLDFTLMDSGKFPVSPRAAPLREALNETLHTFGPVAHRNGLGLRVTPTLLSVRTDPHLLRRMLFNLVSNAVKYSSRGTIEIHAEQVREQVVLHVRDHGPGIAPDRLETIFQDYVTSDMQSPHFDMGVGLGLGIVQRCANLLGHQLTVHSEPGHGSCFSIHLGPSVSLDTEAPPITPSAVMLRGVVAIVENDPVILEGLSEMLREWGCRPVAGTTPVHVQGLLDQLSLTPQLILSDLHLGLPISGFEAIASLRRSTGMADVPAVMLTGDLSPAHQQHAEEQRIRLEHKPLRPVHLREVLSAMLEPPRTASEAAGELVARRRMPHGHHGGHLAL